jgi:sugar diacid utilization regulator
MDVGGSGWIDAAGAELWTDLSEPALRQRARTLGARAARESDSVRDVAVGILRTALHQWTAQPVRDDASAVREDARALLASAQDVLGEAIDGYHSQASRELARHNDDRIGFVNDLLTGRADPGRLAERAHRYGIRLSGTHVVAVVRADAAIHHLVDLIDDALAQRFGAGNTLTAAYEQQLVCISAGGLRGLPAEIAHHLVAHLPAGSWQIGVGRAHPRAAGVVASLDEARDVLDLAGRLGFTSPVLHASDLLVFPVLLRDREAIVDLVQTVLGPLENARGGAAPYLETLFVLFDQQGNYTATARTLHLSVRAVTYRLDRIRALTGYHPGEPTQRFTLHAAVLGARLLGWPSSSDSGD